MPESKPIFRAKRRILFLVALLFFSFFLVSHAEAALFSQTVDTAHSIGSPYSGTWYQLGAGFSGVVYSLNFRGNTDGIEPYQSSLILKEFNDANYSDLNATYVLSNDVPFTGTLSEVAIDGLNITLLPDKFYRLDASNSRQNYSVILAGDSSQGLSMYRECGFFTGCAERLYAFYPYIVSNTFSLRRPASLAQQELTSTTTILEDGIARTSHLVFTGIPNSPFADPVQLQVELRPFEEPFTGADDGGILKSNFVPPGSAAAISKENLYEGPYHWRARTVDVNGNISLWQEFGESGNVDFVVSTRDKLFNQTVDAASSDISYPGNTNWYELGAGFRGTIRSLTFRGNTDSNEPYASNLSLEEFNDPAYGSLNQVFVISGNAPFTGALSDVRIDGLNITLEPNKYYRLVTANARQNVSVRLRGTNAMGVAKVIQCFFNTGCINLRYAFYPYIVAEGLREPVIIVPGIMGTELFRERIGPDDLIWIDIDQAALPGRDLFLNVLLLDENGNSTFPIRTGSIFRGGFLGLRNYYGELIDFFQNNGYEENRDLFTFPYDWRLDNSFTARLLNLKINQILEQTGASKVVILGHSMGGLIVQSYLHQFGGGKVGKIVYLGTPQEGAPKAFNALAFDDVLTNNFIRITGLNRETLHNLAITFPSVFELLYQQPFVTDINESSALSLVRTYSSEFLESTRYVDLASSFYQSIASPLPLPQFNIVGTGVPTLGALDFSTETSATGTLVRDWIPHSTNGDGTVPRASAESLDGNNITTLYACGVEHDSLANNEQVQKLILSILHDQVIANFPCRPVEHFVWYSGSPVRTVVQNSDRLVNGLDDQGNIRREIPASDFMVFENNEGGFLPAASSSYTVGISGLEAGLFSFTFHLIDLDGNAVGSVVFSDVPIARGSHASFDLTPLSTSSQLTVDIDRDNNVDFIIPANQKLNPKTYIQMVDNVLKTFILLPGIETSLSAKLRVARRALEIGRVDVALNVLQALVNEIRVQSGKHLTTDQGAILIRFVEHTLQLL